MINIRHTQVWGNEHGIKTIFKDNIQICMLQSNDSSLISCENQICISASHCFPPTIHLMLCSHFPFVFLFFTFQQISPANVCWRFYLPRTSHIAIRHLKFDIMTDDSRVQRLFVHINGWFKAKMDF
jgi:hypothetical protein